jgi:hypothetical protein
MRRRLLPLVPLAAAVLAASPALAWEDSGHRIIGTVAAQALPSEVPAFLKAPETVWRLGELAREPDRSRGAGQPHDADLDPGHFLDVDDQGKVLGGPALGALPPNRAQYERALAAAHADSWKAGWLPYAIVEGYQQLAKDFAYWRVDRVGEQAAEDPADRDWFARDRALREAIIVRDLGYWSHFVADGSQPLHVTVHYNGWGDFPNPDNYTRDPIHAPFEGDFVAAHVTAEAVRAALPPYQACNCTPMAATERYLQAAAAKVEPLYRLWTSGAFARAEPTTVAFTVERVAAGAAQLRDFVVDAWRASADFTVGYPGVPARRIEAAGTVSRSLLYGSH